MVRSAHYETATGALLTTLRLASHPTDMVWRPGAVEEGNAQLLSDYRTDDAAAGAVRGRQGDHWKCRPTDGDALGGCVDLGRSVPSQGVEADGSGHERRDPSEHQAPPRAGVLADESDDGTADRCGTEEGNGPQCHHASPHLRGGLELQRRGTECQEHHRGGTDDHHGDKLDGKVRSGGRRQDRDAEYARRPNEPGRAGLSTPGGESADHGTGPSRRSSRRGRSGAVERVAGDQGKDHLELVRQRADDRHHDQGVAHAPGGSHVAQAFRSCPLLPPSAP